MPKFFSEKEIKYFCNTLLPSQVKCSSANVILWVWVLLVVYEPEQIYWAPQSVLASLTSLQGGLIPKKSPTFANTQLCLKVWWRCKDVASYQQPEYYQYLQPRILLWGLEIKKLYSPHHCSQSAGTFSLPFSQLHCKFSLLKGKTKPFK